MGPWINQPSDINKEEEEFTTSNKFEKQLLSIKDERQEMIHPKSHPTYNERHQKIIGLIDWALLKYRDNIENAQLNEEQVIIDNIIKELAKKRDKAIHKKKQALLKDEVSMYID